MGRSKQQRWIRAAASLAVLAISAQALGQGAPASSATPSGGTAAGPAGTQAVPAIRADVRALHNDALTAFKAGEYEKAYKGFLAAWNLQKIPRIAGNLGRAELKLAKYRDAAEHLEFFLRSESALSSDDRKLFGDQLDAAKAKVGTVRIEVDQAGADVTIGELKLGPSPIDHDVFVEPGKHTIQASAGDKGASEEVDLAGGAKAIKKLQLVQTKKPGAGHEGTGPIDGKSDAGSKPFPTRTAVIIGGSGLTAGALGVGVAFLVMAGNLKQQARDKQPSPTYKCTGNDRQKCDDIDNLWQEHAVFGNAGMALLIAGGVLGVGTLGYAYVSRFLGGPTASGSIMPVVGREKVGIVVSRSW